jgi:hypothetical protein
VLTRLFLVTALAFLCSGCIGAMVEGPWRVQIDYPRPNTANTSYLNPAGIPYSSRGVEKQQRWTCRRPLDQSVLASAGSFLASWGEPEERIPTARGETWIYADRWRWCGAWVFLIVPIPIMLPVCSTSDRVEVEDGMATRATSWRVDGAGAGVMLMPAPPIFWPFLIHPASPAERHPRIFAMPENEMDKRHRPDRSCP